jgi:hypothetical protein
MTRLHKLGQYKDGFAVVEYCRVCSAEGLKLIEDCPGNFPDPDKNKLDGKNQTANKSLLKTAE